ncbi:macrolide-specific efflux system membrane fusion protein [Parvibaculum indicum]|uniref:efflux RND transporter periplasmic adaptor subunit n=1 Tax=Parvibaculum indicum TaxID=562969 RepID=UPI0019661B2B|nr:efflux RND transporter periplasmic adaptor subunit [Parvibaculum indicum]NIJ42045.1 macrolide-specific efflux system membrane fusion protein [Parvibaculum indicum]
MAAVVLLALWFGYQSLYGGSDTASYQTATVTRGDMEQTVTALGSIQPKDYVDVGAQVSGQLQHVYVEIGDTVKKDQLLAEIDPSVYESEVEAAQARLDNLKAQLAGEQATYKLKQIQYRRYVNLRKQDAVSQDTLDQARAEMELSAAQIKAYTAQIAEQRSTLKGDEANLGYTKIYAPMSGTVVSQTTLEGQTVVSSQSATEIMRVANLDTMTVEAEVAEADVNKLSVDMPVYFTTLGMTGTRWRSTVRQIKPTPTTENDVVLYTVLIDIPNPDRKLMIDMTAQVFFLLGEAKDTLMVPVAAVKTDADGAPYAMVMRNGRPVRQTVETGLKNRVSYQIESGLSEGDKVVTGSLNAASNNGSGRRRPGFL